MRTTELLKKESTELGVKVSDKEEVIDRLASLMDAGGRLKNTAEYKEGILTREALGGTAISEGIAIPYAKVEAVRGPGLAAMVVPEGIDYDAFDGSLANPLFMITAPVEGADVHLEILSRLSTLFMNSGSKEGLIGAADKDEFLRIVDETEVERFGASEGETGQNAKEDAETGAKAGAEAKTGAEADTSSGYQVLAATACLTGTAHTYMVAENLENTRKKLGTALKAEIDGSGGAQNVLTREGIAAADATIIAANKNVEMTRFDGKPVIMIPVADGIHKAEELIKRVVDGTVPVYRHTGAAGRESVSEDSDSTRRAIYKHLMNGVSHTPPFVTDGDVLIAPVFLFDDYSINPANSGKNTSLAAYLKTVGEQALGMILPILAGFIATSIADRSGLAVGLVVGLTAKTGTTSVNSAGGDVNAGFLDAPFVGFVGGYVVAGLRRLFSRPLKLLGGIKPVLLYPVIGIFLVAVVTTFVNPYMGVINNGLTHFLSGMGGVSRIMLGIVLGGMVSTDTGGPFNKAAYVLGTVQLAEGNLKAMAAVMASGTVPSIVIVLCTFFFKKKFMVKERQSGIVSYAMSLSLTTEGIIPFAAQDLLRVIPSCIISSATAGGLPMVFGCTLRASHGGIFVLPAIGNPFTYLAAVVVGATAGCAILGMLKKNAEE